MNSTRVCRVAAATLFLAIMFGLFFFLKSVPTMMLEGFVGGIVVTVVALWAAGEIT